MQFAIFFLLENMDWSVALARNLPWLPEGTDGLTSEKPFRLVWGHKSIGV